MGNQIRVQYVEYPSTVDDGVSSCGGIIKEVEIFDAFGTSESTYVEQHTFLPGVLMSCEKPGGNLDVFNLYDTVYLVRDYTDILAMVQGRINDVLVFVEYGVEPMGGFYQTNIEGEGGIDISLIALYPGYYIGGWFASLEITDYNDAWISRDFQANPDKFNFGEITLDYHGFVCDAFQMDRRKRYINYRTWMPTLEPGGNPEELSVWVPTPTWEKATGIKWGLYPSVQGVLKVWYMRFLVTMDAYF